MTSAYEGPSPQEFAATVWDLAEGFAIIARVTPLHDSGDARTLQQIAGRLLHRARGPDHQRLADQLGLACQELEKKLG